MSDLTQRELANVSEEEYQSIINAAIDWEYLTVKSGGMARKSDWDRWLMERYKLSQADARAISNRAGERISFRTGRRNEPVEWQDSTRPEPQFKDYPEIVSDEHKKTGDG